MLRCALRLRPQPLCLRAQLLRAFASEANRDLYAVLGVPRTASTEDIKQAYRREALRWHPDRHPESERDAASTRFKAVSEAYQVLSDPSQRSRYDALRGTQSYEQATRGAPGYGRDTARAGGASAGGRAWSDAQQERAWREWQRTGGATRPPSGFSEADAERLFREVFGGVGGIADLLRKMQQQQPGRSSAGSWEDVLAQAMRSAAAGARTEVQTSVYTRPSGERVVRTVTTTIGRDGRVSQRVDEYSLGGTQQRSTAPAGEREVTQEAGPLREALRALAAPFIAAAGSAAMRVLARAAVRAVGAAINLLVRRLLGGR